MPRAPARACLGECRHDEAIAAAAISCRFPGRPTCPTASCARSTGRRSTIAGPDSRASAGEILDGIRPIFKTERAGRDLPGLGHRGVGGGAGQHALAGRPRADGRDRPFREPVAARWPGASGSRSELLAGDWRHGVDPERIEARLADDRGHAIKAVCVVHNETSTGVTSRIAEVRRAIDRAGHPALLMVDTISSLASIDYRHDEWGVDVTVAGSQKGLMLPPGLRFNAVSDEGARGARDGAAAALLLGLGADARRQRQGRLSLHARDQPALRPARGARHAARGGAGAASSRATTAMPRRRGGRCAPGASRSCAWTRANTRAR